MSKRRIAVLFALSIACSSVHAAEPATKAAPDWAVAEIPPNAKDHLALLDKVLGEMWPELADRAVIAAQIEQETCLDSLPPDRQKRCWSTKAELKTEREYYFGIGAFSVLYDANGKETMNVFEEVKKLDPSLAAWTWENRLDPEMQLRAVVALDRQIWNKIKFETADERERTAFMLAAYNGGLGHVVKDRKLCQEKQGCDPKRWFGNVESDSVKSKTPRADGKSFFDINREYVKRILDVRKAKYESAFAKKPAPAAP